MAGQQNNPTLHPLPNPRFLRVHLALVKVLNASGAAEVLDRMEREEEDMKGECGNLPPTSTDSESGEEESLGNKGWGPTALSYIDRRLGGF